MKQLLTICLYLLGSGTLALAQTTETFETETVGNSSFTDNGQTFNILNGPGESTYGIYEFVNGGFNGTGSDNRFIDNSGGMPPTNDGSSFTIETDNGADIMVKSFYLFVATRSFTQSVSTSFVFEGKQNGVTQFTVTKNAGIVNGPSLSPNNGFTFIDLSTEGGIDNSNTPIDELVISSTGDGDYLALDAFRWDVVAPCVAPSVPTVSASPSSICPNSNTTLTISGMLNDATAWQIYTSSCGGVSVGSTTSGTFTTANLTGNTTFYVRGEGGCVSPGTCGTTTVTAIDNVPPTVTCPGNQTETPNASCQFVLPDYTGLIVATDNCGTPSVVQSPVAGTIIASNTSVSMTATDAGGNTANCSFMVNLIDNTPPTVSCPGNQTETLNASCQFVLPDYTGLVVATDNCGTPSVVQSPVAGTIISSNTSVSMTATDAGGNNATCNFTVNLVDNTPPTAICQVANAYLDASGNAIIVASDADGGSFDNCSSVSLSLSQTSFTCTDIGSVAVTLTVMDASGNTTTCATNVNVIDTVNSVNNCNGQLIWTGVNSTDWNTASNWNLNLVPTITDSVLIPDVSGTSGNFPLLNTHTVLGDIEVANGASLDVAPGVILEIGTGKTVTSNGVVTLHADATGTGMLDDFSNVGSTFTGNIQVEQYISPGSGLGQRLIGSPVNNGVMIGLDATYTGYPLGQLIVANCTNEVLATNSPYSNLLQWNETDVDSCYLDGWEAIAPGTNLTNGRAYSGWVNDNSIIEFIGTPNTGTINVSGLGNSGSGVTDADGWHLLSNPYPSPVSVNTLQQQNTNFSSYVYYDGGSGAFGGTYQPLLPSENLGLMQGFLVNTTSTNTFTFNDASRTTSNTTFKNNENWFDYKLNIQVDGNGFSDITYLYYNEDASQAFDNQWDCLKKSSSTGQATLFTKSNADNLALNGQHLSNFGESVLLGLESGANGTFTFSFEGLETFPEATTIYLEDKVLNSFHDISDGSYSFDASINDSPLRFELHFIAPVIFTTTAIDCKTQEGQIASVNEHSNRTYRLTKGNEELTSGLIANFDETIIEGQYEVWVYDQFGGFQTYAFDFNAPEAIEAEFEISKQEIEVGENLLIENLTPNASSIVWNINNETFTNQESLNYTFFTAGNYEILQEVTNDECNDRIVKEVQVTTKTTGLELKHPEASYHTYMNHNTLVLELKQIQGPWGQIRLYNLLGQELLHEKFDIAPRQEFVLPKHAQAYYIMKLEIDDVIFTEKIWLK